MMNKIDYVPFHLDKIPQRMIMNNGHCFFPQARKTCNCHPSTVRQNMLKAPTSSLILLQEGRQSRWPFVQFSAGLFFLGYSSVCVSCWLMASILSRVNQPGVMTKPYCSSSMRASFSSFTSINHPLSPESIVDLFVSQLKSGLISNKK